jgi:hypothetical protein
MMRCWIVLAALVLDPAAGEPQGIYDREYPVILYGSSSPTDAVARFGQDLDRNSLALDYDRERGYLAALLRELSIPTSSQTLVFTKTSLRQRLITARTPRAIYFSDDAYVAWVPGTTDVEISGVDPNLGATFYTLGRGRDAQPELERHTGLCLRCHDSFSMSGGGVPRHIVGSGIPDADGNLASHEGWVLTSQETPIGRRWGGWYVTGTSGEETHLGNTIANDPQSDLAPRFDETLYLTPHSDIVALLVLEHQTHVQNLITRVGWDTRMALHRDASADELERIAEPLVRAMLLLDEAPLRGPIRGTSGFAEEFVRRGPFDSRGRSLRELDLETRLFRHPLSYLIYTESFDALPQISREIVYRRLRHILSENETSESRAILEILRDTKGGFE